MSAETNHREELELVEKGKGAVETATRAFHKAIAHAIEQGAPAVDVARAAGFSRQRVYQIRDHERRLKS